METSTDKIMDAATDGSNETSTCTDSGNFHVLLWKLPLTSMEACQLPPAFMAISMEVNYFHRLPWKLP